tara:strand:- start:620 stop:1075 length:456 start_codon:yes stop_codon:yes gene_type:complete
MIDHEFFVELIVKEINENYFSKDLLIQSDLDIHQNPPRDEHIYIPGRNKPLTCIADVYARDDIADPNLMILGEAKTENDFNDDDSGRRDNQLDYYFNYLKYKQKGILIYALPYNCLTLLNEIIEEKKKSWKADNVNCIILTEMEHLILSTS